MPLTGTTNYFEDFAVGDKLRHVRGATVGEFENQMLTKLVMNTAQSHWNEHAMERSPWGKRLVFGLITGSMVIGLATQDCCENALTILGVDKLRFVAPVFHGDTLYAFTEVLATGPAPDREDAGIVVFKHWGVKHGVDINGHRVDGQIVFEGERTALLRRRPVPA
jgi:itaconyl-CoA hydratase